MKKLGEIKRKYVKSQRLDRKTHMFNNFEKDEKD
jgi:hypothetical protein